jgi:sodium-dependent dicarboxylate transporter 2/3/5
MHTLQVAFFFIVSYLLSRVFVVLKIPELIMYYLFEKKHISIQKLTFILLMGSALISSFIANVITVLTLMPLVLLLQNELNEFGKDQLKINTLFLLSVIWGANIGGLGMVTGTTTNGILMGFYEGFKIPVGKDFTFLSWMGWGMPLLVILSCLGWAILIVIFQPGKVAHMHNLRTKLESVSMSRNHQRVGFYLASLFIVTASLLSLSLNLFEGHRYWVIGITVIWVIIYLYLMLGFKWKKEDGTRSKLLHLKDTLHDIPKRGLLWVGIGLAIATVFWYLQLHKNAGMLLSGLFANQSNRIVFYFLLALTAAFSSEIISNMGVHFTMFVVLFPMAKYNPGLSWEPMLIITLVSSCAFMSPIGTPSNGLGFGSSSRISIRHMLTAGFVMNVGSALVVSLWVTYVVPVVNKLILY